MAVQNRIETIKHNRSKRENEELIASGILSLLNKGVGMDVIRYTDIAREIAIDPITVRRHMRDGKFFARNHQLISEGIAKEATSRPSPKLFVPVFFSSVSTWRIWFGIESLRKSYQLLEKIASALYPAITANWPNYSKPDAVYRIICSEIYMSIESLLITGFSETEMSASKLSMTNLLVDIEAGRINMNLLTYLH